MDIKNVTFLEEMDTEDMLKLLRYRIFPQEQYETSLMEQSISYIKENISIIVAIVFFNMIANILQIKNSLHGIFFLISMICGIVQSFKPTQEFVASKKIRIPNLIIGDFLMEIGVNNSENCSSKRVIQTKISKYLNSFLEKGYISNNDFQLIFDIWLWIKKVKPEEFTTEIIGNNKDDSIVSIYNMTEKKHFGTRNAFQDRLIAKLLLEHWPVIEKIFELPKK